MGLRIAALIPFLFLGLGVVFVIAAARGAAESTTRKARMRIGWIFIVVGIGLVILVRYAPR